VDSGQDEQTFGGYGIGLIADCPLWRRESPEKPYNACLDMMNERERRIS